MNETYGTTTARQEAARRRQVEADRDAGITGAEALYPSMPRAGTKQPTPAPRSQALRPTPAQVLYSKSNMNP